MVTPSAADLGAVRSDATMPVPGAPSRTHVAVQVAVAVAATTAVVLTTSVVLAATPVAAALAVGLLLPAAVTDVVERRLPDAWTAAATVALLVAWATAAAIGGASSSPWSIGVGAVVFAGPLLVVHLVSPHAMGFGDVKVALVLGAAAGMIDWRLGLVALTLAAGLAGAAGIACRARTVPFGPFLVVATAVVVVTDHVWLAGLVEGATP